ncbi:hypothetical protein [Thiomonas bhubaneswarensis]|nr:hypothetical protein [Thiomonas bhubaneswarensis]
MAELVTMNLALCSSGLKRTGAADLLEFPIFAMTYVSLGCANS